MRRFYLKRYVDLSGNSGTGRVADGVAFADGIAVIRWLGSRPSTVIWESIEHAESIHGHGGATEFVWIDPDEPEA